jgi:predicted ester cyclase
MKHTLFISAAIALLAFASCNNATTSTEAPKTDSTAAKMENKAERNKKTIMGCMDGFNAHDIDKVMKDASPDMVDYGDGSMPSAKGIDSGKKMLGMLFNSFPDWKGENQMYFADGDNVAVVSDWSLTFKNDFMGMKATGKSTKFKDVDLFTFDNNGKVTSHRNIYPFGVALMQMGCDMSKMEAMDKKKDMKDEKKKM